MTTRVQVIVRGIVQGVGFRPYVFALATQRALRGQVRNTTAGVLIDVEGEDKTIDHFIADLRTHPPPLAVIESIERINQPAAGDFVDFRIVESTATAERLTPIPPDIATCQDCLNELFDPSNRRYHYPFINCTNCGPRFTIVHDLPYDRANTTMRCFTMCSDCAREYDEPTNRRFHAQPNACPACGPQVRLLNAEGNILASELEAICAARRHLAGGRIIAVKGLGGWHLACDACNAAAVTTLRQRKHRDDKPFALMATDLAMIEAQCHLSPAEAALLCSPRRPIVVLRRRAESCLPAAVAPNLQYLGWMLPYTPLHHLLLWDSPSPLVMTSGNRSDEPIAYRDEDALSRLGTIADSFLIHSRDIQLRCDDSVTRIVRRRAYPLRRSRGYALQPLTLAVEAPIDVLACGAELKNTFCLMHRRYAFLSQHIGDLENLETLQAFTAGIAHVKKLLHLSPEVVSYDLHPEYLSTKYALSNADIPLKVGVQHHHAHIASCMADNDLHGEVIGVAMDGLGYGSDGHLWGSEFLLARLDSFERMCHLAYVPLPGGVQAIKEPWRIAAVYLDTALGEDFLELELPFVKRLQPQKWRALQQMIKHGLNCPLSSGMGRLFDAVASLLGLRDTVTYEGQAAVALEMIADATCQDRYSFELSANGSLIQAEAVIAGIVQDLRNHLPLPLVAAKFHRAVAEVIARVAGQIRRAYGLQRVVLSGGVFQNLLLLEWTWQRLEAAGFEVYIHQRVPPNDGGLALGQAVVAAAQIRAGRI